MEDLGVHRLRRVLEAHSQGAYTVLEVRAAFMECVTPENIGPLLRTLPTEVVISVQELLAQAPCADEEWREYRLAEISGVHPGRDETASHNEVERSKSQYREKIEFVRDFLDRHANSQQPRS
jgi:hypothetical protein